LGCSVMSLFGLFHLITFWRIFVDSFTNTMVLHDAAEGFKFAWLWSTPSMYLFIVFVEFVEFVVVTD